MTNDINTPSFCELILFQYKHRMRRLKSERGVKGALYIHVYGDDVPENFMLRVSDTSVTGSSKCALKCGLNPRDMFLGRVT